MIRLKNCFFLHMPRTGGTWARKALHAAVEDSYVYDKPHISLAQARTHTRRIVGDRPAFAFVRHPIDWYISYWKRRAHHGWTNDRDFDIECRAPTVAQFVEKVVSNRKFRGYLSKYFARYTGTPGNEISFVGRYENLRADLVRALARHNEEFDLDIIRNLKPVNVSHPFTEEQLRLPPALASALVECEHAAMVRYGYAAWRRTHV